MEAGSLAACVPWMRADGQHVPATVMMHLMHCSVCVVRQAAQESIAQATARVLEAMARKGKLVRHLRGLLQQA